MTVIKVKCVDQTLVFASTPLVASGGINEDFMQFTFCSKWDGLEKTAVFWRSEADVYHVLLDEENTVQVPPEVTADAGVIYFGVFGVDPAGKQRTSEVLTYTIEQGAITTDTKPSDPTPDIYTQLLTQYAAIVSMYRSKADKVTGAEAGNFAGLDAEGNLVDSGKCPTSFVHVVVGGDEPTEGPVIWFNTTGAAPVDVEPVLLDLDGEGEGDAVSAEIGGEEYGVDNATVNTEPTEPGTYDFNIEE